MWDYRCRRLYNLRSSFSFNQKAFQHQHCNICLFAHHNLSGGFSSHWSTLYWQRFVWSILKGSGSGVAERPVINLCVLYKIICLLPLSLLLLPVSLHSSPSPCFIYNVSFTHPNALFCIISVLGPSTAARCLFMDCTNDRNDKGGGEPVTHKMGKDYKAE